MAEIILDYEITAEQSNMLNFIIKNADAMAYEINSIMALDQYNVAKEICRDSIDLWYGAYEPLAYKRKFGLYDGYDIGIRNGDTFIFEIGPELISGYYHQDIDYVFDITFMQGMHGGPIWRTPIPFFTKPLGPSVISVSPYQMIEEQWDFYLSNGYKTKQRVVINSVGQEYALKFIKQRR